MNMQEVALRMFPFWILGFFMFVATIKSGNKDLLRIQPRSAMKFVLFLILINLYRVIDFHLSAHTPEMAEALKQASFLPWQMTLTVAWEDLCNGLPLVLLDRLIGTRWFTQPIHWIAMLLTMVAFGAGHLYQGFPAAMMLAFYVPLSVYYGKRIGFGTWIIGHILYDLSTVLLVRYMLGAL